MSAILAADVFGYSRLMHNDEEATHSRLAALLRGAVNPAISEHRGRIVKNTGDGFLAEFPSAVEAVRAAMLFQARIKELTLGEVEESRIAFRVGVNIDDVIVETDDIFGDGVNIAARLESIAEPGGICISSSAYDHVRGKIRAEFADLGEQNLKNIARPVRAYAVVQEKASTATYAEHASPGALSASRRSIVVLPFANLSRDPEQEYFADAVTESLTMDLSRISGSFVIGRHTAFTYKGKAIDLKQLGRELDVNYVLEGSVQRGSDRFRVNVQLVDAETGALLWVDRFYKPVTDLFEMQDEIVTQLANALSAQLTEAEANRAKRSPHPNSMDLFFQGRAFWNKGWTPENMAEARGCFERALELDPANVAAMVSLAGANTAMAASYLTDDRAAHLGMAQMRLEKALSLAPNYAAAHVALGGVLVATNHVAQGISECERALALDRNSAEAHAIIGDAKVFLGRGAETEAHMNEALRLSPCDMLAFRWLTMIAFAKLQIDAPVEAVNWFHRSIEANRNYPIAHFGLATVMALLGSLDDARAAAKAGLSLDPSFTIRRFRDGASSDNPTYLIKRERVYEGMRIAGVAEG
ncbi:adenylate/guanylate cyclase domain-containing protein [Bradyrhizobium sp. CCBAU 65884]|uniref:adenylate/guanylate cyclase domain-containing protein n=1 Tax=Bradyrhizobium sp. CCBAU 65884 TaxID=722477 RepID=UPI003FA43A30